MREDVRLSFRGRRPMTAHRGKNKWPDPAAAPVPHDALNDVGDVGDAAAPDANRHTGAGLEPGGEAAALELAVRLCTDIGQPKIREILANEEQAGGEHQGSSGELTVSFITHQQASAAALRTNPHITSGAAIDSVPRCA